MELTKLTKPKTVLFFIVVVLVTGSILQLTSSPAINPPVISDIHVPGDVKAILKKACYDCHSNQSNMKWFDKIVPASYLVASDIKEGRSRFNFSDWGKIPEGQQEVLLWEIVNAIDQHKMPLLSYSITHPSSKITAEDIAVLKKYVNTLPGRSTIDTGKIIRNDQLTGAGIEGTTIPEEREPHKTLNGITYSSDYKSWKVISTTDKYDSGSMRIVYANDIMVKALESKHMPFPDGAKIVKAVWGKQREDKDGNVFPGNFINVQIMIKDSKKYKSTEGWGFAKFDGLKLKPYGKTVLFATPCINCHRLLVKENDFVFNIPTK